MRQRKIGTWTLSVLVAVGLLGACAGSQINPPFYREYRERYAITADELKKIQFYISGQVLANPIDGSSQQVVIAFGTPGLARDSGPDWVRVAFQEGGEGLLFRLRGPGAAALYALATTTEGGRIALVSELPEPILTQGGRRYRVVSGADVHLLVGNASVARVIETRPRPLGLELKSDR